MKGPKWTKRVKNYLQKSPKRLKMIQKCSKKGKNNLKYPKMVQKGSKRFKNGSKLPNSYSKLFKIEGCFIDNFFGKFSEIFYNMSLLFSTVSSVTNKGVF